MANKDVIRVFDTPVNLAANLKDGMFGYDQTGNRFAAKRLSDSVMKYVSEDTLQCLLAGAQTLTGVKTFTQNIVTTSGKIIGIDQVGGIKFGASNALRLGDDFSDYGDVTDKAVNILNGDAQILDFGDIISVNIIQDGTFPAAGNWTFNGDIAFNTDKATWTYSTGAGYVEQTTANFNTNTRMIGKMWYQLTYTISNASGTLGGSVDAVTAENAVTLDMSNGTHIVYFEYKNSANFRLSFTGGAGSSFDLDNITVYTVRGGNLRVFGGIGGGASTNDALYVATDGTIGIAIDKYIGPNTNLLNPQGLAFDSSANMYISKRVQFNEGSGTSGVSGVETIQSGQTVDAATVNLDFDGFTANSSVFTVMIYVAGSNADFSKAYGEFIVSTFKQTGGGTFTEVGSETQLAQDSEFSTSSVAVSAASGAIRVACTGEVGETIDWAATLVYFRSTP